MEKGSRDHMMGARWDTTTEQKIGMGFVAPKWLPTFLTSNFAALKSL
jgi:hypothetical protein